MKYNEIKPNKRIVHISSVHTTFDNRIFFKECKSLYDAGYEVYLITPYEKTTIVDGIKIFGIRKPNNRFFRMFFTTGKAIKIAMKIRPAIYHIHDPELLPWGIILSIIGKKVIFDMHENLSDSIYNKNYLSKYLRLSLSKIFYYAEKLLIRKINVIYAENSYCHNNRHSKPFSVILNMPKVKEITRINESKKNTFTVGYMGRVSNVRGSIVTLKALKIIKDNGLSVGYECVGYGETKHMAEIHGYIKEAELNNIRYHGFLKALDGFRIIARCHVGLILLEPIPNYLNSFPTKLFEYMALGLPVILSDIPFYRSIVKDENCALLVNPTDPHAIANAIQFLKDNTEKTKLMGKNGRRLVMKRYNWDNEFKKLIDYYSLIITGNDIQSKMI